MVLVEGDPTYGAPLDLKAAHLNGFEPHPLKLLVVQGNLTGICGHSGSLGCRRAGSVAGVSAPPSESICAELSDQNPSSDQGCDDCPYDPESPPPAIPPL
jgi:hypothetical protein